MLVANFFFGFEWFKANSFRRFSVASKKPWSFASVTIQQKKAILHTACGKSLTLNLAAYQQHFDGEKGTALFNEVTVIMNSDQETAEQRRLIYLAIWNIFRCDWVHYIASIQSERSSSHKCMFSTICQLSRRDWASIWFFLSGLKHVLSGEADIRAGYSVLTPGLSCSSE